MVDVSARHRAHQASKELRETEAAFDGLRDALVAKFIASPAEAQKTRDTCYFAINALDGVRTALREVVDGGVIEEAIEDLLAGPPKPEVAVVLPIRRGI